MNQPENRALGYSNWHRTLDKSLYALDVDFIEWRRRNGNIVPVALIEITRVDNNVFVGKTYLDNIVKRYDDGIQGLCSLKVSRALGIKAYIVLFRENLNEFWLYNLSEKRGWTKLSQREYVGFLKSL